MRAESRPSHGDPWRKPARTTLEIVTGGSFAAFLLAHAQLEPSPSEGSLLVYWLAGAALLLLPLAPPLAARWLEFDRRRRRRWSLATVLLGALALANLGGASPWHYVLGGLTFALGSLLVRQREQRAAAWLLALAPVQVLVAMGAAPSGGWLLHLPLVVAAVCVGALVQSGRHARQRLATRAPRRLVRALEEHPPTRRLRLERLRVALPLSATTLALCALFYPALAAIPRPDLRPGAGARRAAQEARDERDARAEEQLIATEGSSRVFGGELTPGAALSEQAQEVVMTVRPRRTADDFARGQPLGPLYLRGACLDTFTASGMRSRRDSQPTLVRDGDDGRRDGWTRLVRAPLEKLVWLDIQQQSFRTRSGGWEVLFAPQPPLALRAASVYHDPDGLLAFRREAGGALVEYTLLASARAPRAAELELLDARHSDPQFLQLPPASPELDWIERVAIEQTASARSDLARVEALLAYFARDYSYSLRTRDVPGLAGIVSFMRRGKGHCTSFAATAVLMLRTLGLSARVATGFLASRWSDEDQLYLVSTANGHAWIEVYFEGHGWCRFDPTPSSLRESALNSAALGLDEGLGAWWSDLRADLGAWSRSGADESELALLLDTLIALPRAAWLSAVRHPLRATLVPIALAYLLHRFLRRRPSARSPGAPSREAQLLEQLLAALRRAGAERRPGETLRELARRASTATPDPELEFAVSALYRARFAPDSRLQPAERVRIGEWIEQENG